MWHSLKSYVTDPLTYSIALQQCLWMFVCGSIVAGWVIIGLRRAIAWLKGVDEEVDDNAADQSTAKKKARSKGAEEAVDMIDEFDGTRQAVRSAAPLIIPTLKAAEPSQQKDDEAPQGMHPSELAALEQMLAEGDGSAASQFSLPLNMPEAA